MVRSQNEVIAAFLHKRSAGLEYLWTDGRALYSGPVLIAKWDGEKVVLQARFGPEDTMICSRRRRRVEWLAGQLRIGHERRSL